MEDCIKVIEGLNAEIYEKYGETEYQFSYSTNGYCELIKFGEEIIWSSEMDDREFFEETNTYEPFVYYIKNVYNKYLDRISKLRLDHIEQHLDKIV